MPSYVITGASRGIGLEFVKQLASNPDNVVFAVVRNTSTAVHLMPLIGGNLHVLEAFVQDYKGLQAAAAEVPKVAGGSLDVLINNAARTGSPFNYVPVTECSGREDELEGDLIGSFRVAVLGTMHTIIAFLPLLRASSTPLKKVVTISSAAGDRDFVLKTQYPLLAGYAIAKAALNMAVTKYAIQLKDEGFVCVLVQPGLVSTRETAIAMPNPEEAAGLRSVYDSVINAFPKWTPNVMTVTESVGKQLKMIGGLEMKDTGAFVSETGSREFSDTA